MSWVSKQWDISGKRDEKRARRREYYRQLAIGPAPQGQPLDAGILAGTQVGETPEERKRRLRRMATILDEGGDMFGDLTLGRRGLLSR